jgi:uncharacterized membrane protein YgcG
VSQTPKEGYRWLDSLARWSARGRDDARPATGRGGNIAVGKSGTTRRTALRTAVGAGTVAILGPARLLEPSIAGAVETTPLEKCVLKNYASAYGDLKACTLPLLEKFDDLSEEIAKDENSLRKEKKPAARRRLKKAIQRATRERAAVQKNVDFCNALFLEERAVGEAKCNAENPPSGGSGGGAGGGSGGGGGTGGCESGFSFCADHCCDLSNAYCQGCPGKVVCCRLESDCCPSG